MAQIKIDGIDYDTENLNATQKRLLGLYQSAMRDESETMAKVEIFRAARIEITRRIRDAFGETQQPAKNNS